MGVKISEPYKVTKALTNEQLAQLDRYIDTHERMETLSDKQLANELTAVWEQIPQWSTQSAILGEAIARIRRSCKQVEKQSTAIQKVARQIGRVAYKGGQKIGSAKTAIFENK